MRLGKVSKGAAPTLGGAGGDATAKYGVVKDTDLARQKYLEAKRILKSKMEQEQRNSRANSLKIQTIYRKIMRINKVDGLRKEIEILSQNHERDVDRKDAIIQMLDRDLEEAEDQFGMALRAHLQNMDKLIDLQDSRLLGLEQEFESELVALESEFNNERKQIVTQHSREVGELNDIMNAIDVEESEREAEARQEHEQLREEIRNKNLEEINVLRITLDTQIEDLEQMFETAHWQYLQNTDQRTTEFKSLTRKDQELSKEIEQKIRKIDRLQSSLQHWRMKISQNVKECAQRNSNLQEEKNGIQAHFQNLKSRMNKFRSTQKSRLSELTKNANGSKNLLKDKCDLAERILKLSELGRKMETEQEKVTPFYVSSVEGEIEKQAEAMMQKAKEEGEPSKAGGDDVEVTPLHSSAWSETGKPVGKWNHLDQFWKKYNKVLLDALAIEKEEEKLKKENADLQEILKQYFDGISVNDEVLQKANPLFVTNFKVNLNKPMAVRREETKNMTFVEANAVVNQQKMGTMLNR
ncbi:hypothetical protein TrVE_jg2490 [Triparma verrucosa]|uniref:Dynein regulatory complex subunit 2 n=1 Tax=Triparma verrucosa TaxID=1606542 RepID=A0A9W7EYS9_9STRA|nr:hypothetical protein TrVE_jg2490 [Triparma verrucosa]